MRSATTDFAFTSTAVLIWAGALYKLVRAKRGTGRRASYALVYCLAFLGAAVTLQIRPVYTAMNVAIGEGRWFIMAEALAVCAVCAYQVLMVLLNNPDASARRRIYPRISLAAASLSAMVVFFFLSPSSYPGLLPAGEDPAGAIHMVVYIAYLGGAAIDIGRGAFRFTRLGGDRNLLRLALYMIGAHACVTTVYAGVKLVCLVLMALVGPEIRDVQYAITNPLIVFGSLLIVVGSTLPSWGPHVGVERLAAWFGRYMSYLTLYPLWRVLVTVAPGLVLEPRSQWADRLLPLDIDFRLTRRVIEIRDGLLLLDQHRDGAGVALARQLAMKAELHGVELHATVEAASIASALINVGSKSRDERVGGADAVVPLEVDAEPAHTAVNIADEVSWLAQVSHAFRHSAIVRSVRTSASTRRRTPTVASRGV